MRCWPCRITGPGSHPTSTTGSSSLYAPALSDRHGWRWAWPVHRAGRRLEDREVLVFHLRNGKVTEVWQYLEDQYTYDKVFS